MPRSGLLTGCALGALLATLPAVADAQSFAGTPTVVTGDASITTDPGGIGIPATTNIAVLAEETVIDWTVTNVAGATFTFQPSGTVATFDGDDLSDYTVLNRILPFDFNTFPIASAALIDGTVESYVNPIGGGRDIGGQVWFYSPTGIIAGPNSLFNVGSLILTTDDIQFVPAVGSDPGSIYGPGGVVLFRGPADSSGYVEIQSGAEINALGNLTGSSAYVALVAPRIEQGGFVGADGNIAYIAAEEVNMTISGGLFDFVVQTGTTDANGIVHTGTTTGPESVDSTDFQRIMMVAIPKNDAMTMLLSGNIGYSPATLAFNEGSAVVLAAGFTTPDPIRAPSGVDASIEIGNSAFSNQLTAWAANAIDVAPDNGTVAFNGANTSLNAASSIDVTAQAREFVTSAGNLSLSAGVPGVGGDITVFATTSDFVAGGEINVVGDFVLDAGSDGILPLDVLPADGQGGTVRITADGGLIQAANLFASATGEGNFANPLGGTGQGGTVSTLVLGLGTIRADAAEFSTNGFGGYSDDQGGNGIGGDVSLTALDGTLDFNTVTLSASGRGGESVTTAGDGTGGGAVVNIGEQAQEWDFLSIDTSGNAGRGSIESSGQSGSGSGGSGVGGSFLNIVGPGSLTIHGDLVMTSNAYMQTFGATGFAGQGGNVALNVSDGGSLTVEGTVFAHASALFDPELFDPFPFTSPTQQGGTVDITAQGDSSRINAFGLDARAEAVGLSGVVAAGSATGGDVTVSALSGSQILIETDSTGLLAQISATAYGSPGPIASDATGGTARIIVEDGQFTVTGDLELSADGRIGEFGDPPPDGFGFNATGGTATIELLAGSIGNASFFADDVAVTAIGDGRLFLTGGAVLPGGDPIDGDGGDGTGGSVSILIGAGTLTVDTLTLDSSGIGGGSGISPEDFPFESGDGFGGSTLFQIGGGDAGIGSLDLVSNGVGGDGTSGPAAEGNELATLAGNGTGGNTTLQLDGGSLVVTDTQLEANGVGGPGMDQIDDGEASDGGDGTGGNAQLATAFNWTGSFSTATLGVYANGEGGNGGFSDPGAVVPPLGDSGAGGDGTGGTALVDFIDGAFSIGSAEIDATGHGGDSGDTLFGLDPDGAAGGNGIGGTARFTLIDNFGPVATRALGSLDIDASGLGGFGTPFAGNSGAGGANFVVSVLDAASALDLPGSVTIFATGLGLMPTTGIQTQISGAPLEVGTDITMIASGPVIIDAVETLSAGGFVTLEGIIVGTTGLIQSSDAMSISGLFNVSSERLISGATTFLRAPLGTIYVGDLNSVDQVDASAQSIEIHSTGGLDFLLAEATAGDLWLETQDNLDVTALLATGSVMLESNAGNVTTNDFTAGTFAYVDAFGTANLGNIVAGIDAAVTTRGGNLTVGNVTAGDDIWLSVFGTNAGSLVTAGDLVSTGLGADDATGGPGELWGDYPNQAGPSGNVTRIRSSGLLLIGDVETPGRAILVADQGTMTLGNLSGDEALLLLGAGDIELDTATTGGVFYVANQSMFLPNLPDAYDPASLAGLDPVRTSGTLTTTGTIAAGSVSVAVGGDITLPDVGSQGTTFLDAGGTVDIDNLDSLGTVDVNADDDVFIVGLDALTFTNAQAGGQMSITTSGDLAMGQAFAGSEMVLSTSGTFSLSGQAQAATIAVDSNDIELDSEAQVGLRGLTTSVTLTSGDGASRTVVGDGVSGEEGDYTLDGGEASRLFADESIEVVAQGDIAVGDLALTFGGNGNIGTGGTFELTSPTTVSITGDVELTTSSADDTFRIDPLLIALNTDTGSISMFSGEGVDASGRLELVADRVVAATGDVIDQLETLTDLDAITDLLGQPGGTGNPISAGSIDIEVIDGVYIQNSGASDEFAERRGFSANSLNIETESGDTQIAINGQILTPDGPVTGLDTIPLVSIDGEPAAAGGQFDARSSINGCVIGTDCGFVPEPEPERPIDPPSDDDLTPIDPIEPPGGFTVAPLIELAGTDPLIDPPLVDEPITGVGNDDLWQPPCEDEDADGVCPEGGEEQ